MRKHKRWVATLAALVNLLFVLLIAHAIWRYYKVWDKFGPNQLQFVNVEGEKLNQTRLKYDEEMLRILNYYVLPANAAIMIFSGVVLWLYRRGDKKEKGKGVSPINL